MTVVKCAHPACTCTVRDENEFCSQYCKDAGENEVEISCDCGHPGCSIDEAVPGRRTPTRTAV
jgi:hypothetical protein